MKNKKQAQDKPFKVGDKIVDFGQVHRIFKIKKKKGPKGEEEKVICYRYYYKISTNRGLSFSIPVKNLEKTNIRRPISKKRLREFLKELAKMPEKKKSTSTTKAKSDLTLNDPFKTARILKNFWLDKNDESTKFGKAKQDILGLAMKRLVEEVALVFGISVTKARKKIKRALRKGKKDENSVH